MSSAASNLANGHANLSFPHRAIWDKDANDAGKIGPFLAHFWSSSDLIVWTDFCCESWGGASPEKGGPTISYVLWGADGQGSSGFKTGPEGFAAIGTANMTLEKLLQAYF